MSHPGKSGKFAQKMEKSLVPRLISPFGDDSAPSHGVPSVNDSNLKAAVVELRNVFATYLPAEDVAAVLRKAVERALLEVLGNAPKRRGRPPKNAAAASAPAAAAKASPKKKGRSPASRAKQAAKMRAYWAARKAAEAGSKGGAKKKRGRPAKAKAAEVPAS